MPDVPALLEQERITIEASLVGNSFLNADRLIRLASHIAANAYGTMKDAIKNNPYGFVRGIVQCADVGLEPNTPLRQAALTPFKNKAGTYTFTLIIQYQGYVHLMTSCGAAEDVSGSLVFQDEIDNHLFYQQPASRLEPLFHQPDPLIKRPTIKNAADAVAHNVAGAYSIIWLPSGRGKAKYMELEEIEYIRKTYSRAAEVESGKSPWETRWSEMALKTVLRNNVKTMRLIGTAPKLNRAVEIEAEQREERADTHEPAPDNYPTGEDSPAPDSTHEAHETVPAGGSSAGPVPTLPGGGLAGPLLPIETTGGTITVKQQKQLFRDAEAKGYTNQTLEMAVRDECGCEIEALPCDDEKLREIYTRLGIG